MQEEIVLDIKRIFENELIGITTVRICYVINVALSRSDFS